MFSGGLASLALLSLICNWTVSPIAASELLNTAVTLGESANAASLPANAISAASKTIAESRTRYIDMFNQISNYRYQSL